MKSDHLTAALLVGTLAVGLAANLVRYGTDDYCPSASAASVTALFAPCQTFDSAMGHLVSKDEAVRMGLLTPDQQPVPGTQLAAR